MKYIEDYVSLFANYVIRLSNFDEKIAMSLGSQCLNNNPFTAKQAEIANRLLKKYKSQFVSLGHTGINQILEAPIYRNTFRVVDNRKIVSVNQTTKKFSVKFPYDQDLVTKMRGQNNKNLLFKAQWDGDEKYWALELSEASLKFIIDDLAPMNFEFSEDVKGYIEQYRNITDEFDKYIPMLVKDNGTYKFKNVKTEFATTDLLTALVQSAKYAIHVFDDEVSEDLAVLNHQNPMSKVFAQSENQNFQLSKNDYTRTQLISFAKNMDCMTAIFLDESASADTMQMWVEALKSCGIDLNDVGVFCRRKNDTEGIKFNTVVKDYGLNKAATDEVKWAFLMTKYPKSLIKADKIPEICLFDNKYINAHHTVRSIIKNSVFNFLHNDHITKGDDFVVL